MSLVLSSRLSHFCVWHLLIDLVPLCSFLRFRVFDSPGGVDSEDFKQFTVLCTTIFSVVRENASTVYYMLRLMLNAGLPELQSPEVRALLGIPPPPPLSSPPPSPHLLCACTS